MSGPNPVGHGPGPQLPPGLRVAGTRVRVGAWLLDSLGMGAIGGVLGALLVSTGSFRENPEALRQLQADPATLPSVALYHVDLGAVALVELTTLLAIVVYSIVCWHRFRALPGQRVLSLQVGDAATGRTLSLRQSLLRSILLYGLAGVAGVILVLAFSALLGTVALVDMSRTEPSVALDGWSRSWGVLLLAAAMFSVAWPVVLLIATANDRHKQGLHDRLAGSLVVARVPEPTYRPAPAVWPHAWAGTVPSGAGYASRTTTLGPMQFALDPQTVPGDQFPGQSGEETGPPGQPSDPEPTPLDLPPDGPPTDRPVGDTDSTQVPRWMRGNLDDAPPPRPAPVPLGKRVGAYLLDCVLIYMMFTMVLTLMAVGADKTHLFSEKSSIVAGFIGGAVQAFYFVGGLLLWRGSLGQRVLHLEVTNVMTKKRLGFQDAFLRWTLIQGPFAASTIVPFAINQPVLGLAFAWALFLLYSTNSSPDGRGIHDRLVGSVVTRDY